MPRPLLSLSLSLVLATLTGGCGPVGQQFHGDYSASGTATFTLNNYGSQTSPVKGSLRVSEGVDSDVVILDQGAQCALPADVEGEVATLRMGTTCTEVIDGGTLTLTLTGGTAVRMGRTLQLNYTGNMTATLDGRAYPGSFSQTLTLTRIGK